MVTLTGCGGISKPTTFFMLSPIDMESGERSTTKDEISILVGPITVPVYLNRDQIVVRQPGVEVSVNDFDHWAEPLSDNLKRVLVANLSTLLSSSQVYNREHRNLPDTKYQLTIDISRFDNSAEGAGVLLAFWTLSDRKGKVLKREKSLITAQSSTAEIESYVEALNELVSEFSRQLAGEIKGIEAS